MNEPEEITSLKGHSIPRKISVDYISFSAHVDFSQNSEFIELVKAQHVVSSIAFLHDSVCLVVDARFLSMVKQQPWVVYELPWQAGSETGMRTLKFTHLEISRRWSYLSVENVLPK